MTTRQKWIAAGVAAVAIAVSFLGCEGDYARPSRFSSAAELNRPDCRIGVYLGYAGEERVRGFFPMAQIVGFDEIPDVASSLLAGKLEAFVCDEHILNVAIRAYPMRFQLLDDALECSPAVAVVSAKNTNLLAQVNAFISQYRRDGTYDAMLLRWCQCDKYVPIPEIEPSADAVDELRIGTDGLTEPSSFVDDNGDLTGFDVEFGLRLAKFLGRKPRFVLRPDSNFDADLRSGIVDVVLDDFDEQKPRRGLAFSDGYLDSDLRVLVAADDPDIAAKTKDQMLGQTRVGATDVLIGNTRLRLFVNGLLNTVMIALLSALLGFAFAWLIRRGERRLPRCAFGILDAVLSSVRRIPPVLLILVFNGGVLPFASPWITVVVALGFWFAAFLEPTADSPASVWLPIMRLHLPTLLQWTSVAGAVNVFDLTMATDLVCGRTFSAVIPLVAVALAYILLSWLFDSALRLMEKRCR